jgi:hypothetical protein
MSGGWTVVDSNTNKSVPVGGANNSGASSVYITQAPGISDAVGKMRVSQGQALIDTDFEYGPQPTKWETLALQNNRNTAYYIPQAALNVNSITGFGTSASPLTVAGTFVVPANSLIYIQNSIDAGSNGWGFTAAGGTNSMSVVMGQTGTISSQKFNSAGTYVYVGYFYTGSGFALDGTARFATTGGTSVSVDTQFPHGLATGSLLYVVGTTSSGTSINGPQTVSAVNSSTNFNFTNVNGAVAASAITNSIGQTNLYARSAGYVESRPYDGGVAFSAGSIGSNQQLIRQSRRYFRYQSGKSIQFSTGSSLAPALFVTTISNSSTTVTVTTRFAHNLSTNSTVKVENCTVGYFNGTFRVVTTPSATTFTYTIQNPSTSQTAVGFPIRVTPFQWYGASNRVGLFDQQNGMFFEFDGTVLSAVQRNSTTQINGTVTVTNGSGLVTGSGTAFASQLSPGDWVVIRGQSYRITAIQSNTSLTILPEYRGTTITSPSNALLSRTVDLRVPQSLWNLDRLNGTGPSGYTIDVTKMQMWFIDYSWYGAGVIRWGVRATNGQIIYCHQQVNNNKQFEAYMRSGNLPSHYESNGIVGYSATTEASGATFYIGNWGFSLSSAASATATTLEISAASSYFPTQGGVGQLGSGATLEYFSFSSATGNFLTNVVRGILGTTARAWPAATSCLNVSIGIANTYGFNPNGGSINITSPAYPSGTVTQNITYIGIFGNFIYGITTGLLVAPSSTAPFLVEYSTPDTTAPLAHWGSSVIMDGNFNDDKSLVFNYGTTTAVSIAAGATAPILAIRVAPSADNNTTGLLGVKETINRMQLQLTDMAVVASGAVLVNLILNGVTTGFTGTFGAVATGTNVSSSLAQVAVNTSGTATIAGGESVTALYANGVQSIDLSQVRDLGNSISGGGVNNTVPTTQAGVYPDGPDILYIAATNTTGSAVTVLARINWKEAQA